MVICDSLLHILAVFIVHALLYSEPSFIPMPLPMQHTKEYYEKYEL